MDIEQRFWSKVAKGRPDQCWPWKAAKVPKGYGVFCWNRDGTRNMPASRAAGILAGVIDGPSDPRVVRHKCDNPPCCNPLHLEAGTHADNTRDMMTRNNSESMCRVTAAMKAEIVQCRANGESAPSIAKRLGICSSTVYNHQKGTVKWLRGRA